MYLRRVARPMLAAQFIQGGISALRAPEGHAAAARPVLEAVAPAVDKAIEIAPVQHRPDDVTLIKIDGAVKIVAGTLLAFGKFPRLASTTLAASLIPTTLAGHRFWEETDPQRKREQQIHFVKNVGLLGGLLIAAADTEGKPSIAWRSRKAAKLAAAAAAGQAASVSGAAHEVSGRISGTAAESKGKVAGLAAGLAGLAPAAGAAVTSHKPHIAAELSSRAEEISAEWAKRAAKARRRAEKRGAKLQKRAAKRSAELQKRAAKRSAQLQKMAGQKVAAMEKAVEKAFEKRAHAQKGPGILDQATKLGHDVAVRASAVGAEVVHQAEGAAKDVRKRAHAITH